MKSFLWPLATHLPRGGTRLSWETSLETLKRLGLHPRTVFDIGVAYGTPQIYRAFPDAHYHLVDPTPESARHMHVIARHLSAEVHNLALGDRDDEVEMDIRHEIGGSTLFEEAAGVTDFWRRQRVPMRRFDSLFAGFERPAFAKIDVQGAELMVLRGMSENLASIDAILIELSAIATLKNGPELRDVLQFLGEHGFVLYDVLGLTRRPLDDAPAQLDILFVPENSYLRADRRWNG